jgi:hypothetical protein
MLLPKKQQREGQRSNYTSYETKEMALETANPAVYNQRWSKHS